MTKTLYLLRHAETEEVAPGQRDHERRLTGRGEAHARAVGAWLADHAVIDAVLCSTAVRARQTLAACSTNPSAEFAGALYNGGSDTILEAIRALPEDADTALVVGHAPGVPGLVYDLADPAVSDPQAMATIDSRYPAGTLAQPTFEGPWSELDSAALVQVRLPRDQ